MRCSCATKQSESRAKRSDHKDVPSWPGQQTGVGERTGVHSVTDDVVALFWLFCEIELCKY